MTATHARDRRRRLSDDCGSMPLVMVLTIVGVGLSLLLAATVVTQQRTTRFDARRAHAINAAQTGIDVAVSTIRATMKSDGSGDLTQLPPCGTLTGTVSQGAAASYSLTIYYLSADPPSGDVVWAKPRSMCAPGDRPTSVPRYALLESTGYALPNTPGRRVVATYAFSTSTSNPNIPGGLIHAYREGAAPDLCLSADRNQLNGGEPLIVAICDSTSGRQKLAYEANLNLVLVASRTTAHPAGMCVDAGPQLTQNTAVKFQPCAATTIARQQWGQNDYSAFQGTTDGVNLNNFCLNIVSPGRNLSPVVLGDTSKDQNACLGAWSNNKTFFPDSSVGTGRAGRATKQLVNYNQFGRCIDVTENKTDTTFLVVFPCKQQPTGTVLWNQAWNLPSIPRGATSASGPIYTTNGSAYCLTSPGSTPPDKYPTLTVCNPGTVTDPKMIWTYRADSGLYSNSYRVESTFGAPTGSQYCLTPTASPDLWTVYGESRSFSKVALAPCGNSALQKWNASPTIVGSALKDVVEP